MLKLNRKVKIIQKFGNGVIAICKGDGVLSHPNSASGSNDVSIFDNAIYDEKKELYQVDTTPNSTLDIGVEGLGLSSCYLLHRLDKRTSGVMLLSTELESAVAIKSLFKAKIVNKEYYALVHGRFMPTATMVWKDNMRIAKSNGTTRALSSSSSYTLNASTKVTGVAYDPVHNVSTLLLQPQSGITHQLRFQCAQRDLPIVGDDVYGKFSKVVVHNLPKKRLYLHAHRIQLQYTFQGNDFKVDATAPLPDAFLPFILTLKNI